MEARDFSRVRLHALIPRLYFFACNENLKQDYSTLLLQRIFATRGKDNFSYTRNIQYKYEHDFSIEEKYIARTKATKKQIKYLKELGESNRFLLCRKIYLSKSYATTLIDYLNGTEEREPSIFSFFFVAV